MLGPYHTLLLSAGWLRTTGHAIVVARSNRITLSEYNVFISFKPRSCSSCPTHWRRAASEDAGDEVGDVGDIYFVVAVRISLIIARGSRAISKNSGDQESHIGDIHGTVVIRVTGCLAAS